MLAVRPLGESRSAAGPPFVEVAFKGGLFPVGTPACLALCHELLHDDSQSRRPLFYSQKDWSSGTLISLLRSCSAELSVVPHLSCSGAVREGLGARTLRTGDACSVSSADAVQGAGLRKGSGLPVGKGEAGLLLWILHMKMVSINLVDLHRVTGGSKQLPFLSLWVSSSQG